YNEKSYIFMLTGNADSENSQPVVYGKCIVLAEYAGDATDGRLALYNSLKDEVSAREAADTALQESIDAEVTARKSADTALQSNITSEVSARELESYYPEYHSDESTGNFYLDCANVDNAGTALFKAKTRGVTQWDLASGCGFALEDDNITDSGIVSTDGALTTTLTSYAGFNTETSFTILFDARIPQQSDTDAEQLVLFQLGNTRVLQIQQRGVDGIRLVTYDSSSTSHVYPSLQDDGHYVVPETYGAYQHFAVVFDTGASTVTWYQNGSVYATDTMDATYVKVDGGYSAKILENPGMGLRYFKIVRSAMTAAEVKAYMAAHPHTNYTNQPKTQYDNILLELERRIAALESA
ncbi:MAG: hypothetical protein LIO53_01795, partial [Oscillospiraceae bacterium]|nr:hypothetical protein [Oscillospiraceae bacterium]